MSWTSVPSTTSSPEATTAVGDDVGFEIAIGLDLAASERFQGGHYRFGDERRTPAEQIDYVADPVETYDLVYVEDPLEEDFTGFAELTERVGDRAPICGDDLYVTDVARIERGIDAGAGNSVLVKPNQIGTPSATVDAVELAVESGLAPVVSRQSGETEDATIAHLAVAVDSPYLKAGAVGGERTAKLNELVRIEAGAAGVRQARRRSVDIW